MGTLDKGVSYVPGGMGGRAGRHQVSSRSSEQREI